DDAEGVVLHRGGLAVQGILHGRDEALVVPLGGPQEMLEGADGDPGMSGDRGRRLARQIGEESSAMRTEVLHVLVRAEEVIIIRDAGQQRYQRLPTGAVLDGYEPRPCAIRAVSASICSREHTREPDGTQHRTSTANGCVTAVTAVTAPRASFTFQIQIKYPIP